VMDADDSVTLGGNIQPSRFESLEYHLEGFSDVSQHTLPMASLSAVTLD